MDDPKKSKQTGEEEKNDPNQETDERLNAELKELIEFNELQTGALKKIMKKFRENENPDK